MSDSRYMSAIEAADALDISLSTLYAYVSRGMIRSEATIGNKRERRYYREDINRMLARRESKRNPEKLAEQALYRGSPVLESALTLIDNHRLYYRGQDALQLATDSTPEAVAALLWTGDASEATNLFQTPPDTKRYETLLLRLEVEGLSLTPLQELQALLPLAASEDIAAYDLRPATVTRTGARILHLMGCVLAGDVDPQLPLADMLHQGWCPAIADADKVLRAALILCADHELNASAFTARVVASARSTPYAVVIAGLAALQGTRHGGYTERVAAFLQEAQTPRQVREVMAARLRRGEAIPGFGHRLYPDGDPRARLMLSLLRDHDPGSDVIRLADATITAADNLMQEKPTIDFTLVLLETMLRLPAGSALAIFALGRTIGWIAHAIETYQTDRLIRPRARYTGIQPGD